MITAGMNGSEGIVKGKTIAPTLKRPPKSKKIAAAIAIALTLAIATPARAEYNPPDTGEPARTVHTGTR